MASNPIKLLSTASQHFIPTGNAVDSYRAERCTYAIAGNICHICFNIVPKSNATSPAVLINGSDLGVEFVGSSFGVGYSASNVMVKVISLNGTIQIEQFSTTFPTGMYIYGQITVEIK